jgi:hypothetical protein
MNRWNARVGIWRSRNPVVGAPAAVAPLPSNAPVRHPVLVKTEGLYFMVVRLYRRAGVLEREPIGEFKSEHEAVACVRAEAGRARATNTSGKIVADNFREIEERA